MSQFTHPKGVLLVGSLPVPSNEDAFKLSCQTLPGRLASIPDGETGNRHKWVGWQCDVFPQETLKFNSATMLSRRHDRSGIPLPNGHTGVFTQDDVKPSLYDQVAKDSYQKFKELRNQGIIPPGVRFQVSLPTPQASIQAHLRPEFQAPLEPFYEKRIYDAIDSIVEEIPPEDLSLQLDLCLEVTSLEYERGRLKNDFFKPYFYPIYEGVLERIQRMADHIPDNVPLGIHPCYGDLNHKHFMEPEDLGIVVDFANDVSKTIRHSIDWIHLAVPKNRDDPEYFAPLARLDIGTDAKLYLGLVHFNDEEGTRKRIQAAQTVVKDFGVATECGIGRTPAEELSSILQISRDVSIQPEFGDIILYPNGHVQRDLLIKHASLWVPRIQEGKSAFIPGFFFPDNNRGPPPNRSAVLHFQPSSLLGISCCPSYMTVEWPNTADPICGDSSTSKMRDRIAIALKRTGDRNMAAVQILSVVHDSEAELLHVHLSSVDDRDLLLGNLSKWIPFVKDISADVPPVEVNSKKSDAQRRKEEQRAAARNQSKSRAPNSGPPQTTSEPETSGHKTSSFRVSAPEPQKIQSQISNPLSISPPSRPAAFEYNGMAHRPDPQELNGYTSNRPPFNTPGGTGAPGYRNSQYRPEPQQPPNNYSANNTPITTPRIPIEYEYDDAQDRPGPGGFHHRHASNHSTLRPPKRPAAGPVDDVPDRKGKGNPKRPKPGPRPKNKGPKSPGRSNAVPGKPSNAANWPDRRLARQQQKARRQQN